MNITIITDAWEPQTNGVVRTYQNIIPLIQIENSVEIIHPYLAFFKRKPLPGYKEIEIVINPWAIKKYLNRAMDLGHHIHIATEGPIGLYSRLYLKHNGYSFTTSFHTLFPEFLQKRFYIPTYFTYPFFRWFHNAGKTTLVPAKDIIVRLYNKGFKNPKLWTRGVDTKIFNPNRRRKPEQYIIYVARASKEKNIDEFCQLSYPRKIFVGDGPYLEELKEKYKFTEFVGKKTGKELAELVANADMFVFPSKSDTFGIVILEAIACGTPVAAFYEPGPREVIKQKINGYCSNILQIAVNQCMSLDREKVYETSQEWTWERSAKQFLEGIK